MYIEQKQQTEIKSHGITKTSKKHNPTNKENITQYNTKKPHNLNTQKTTVRDRMKLIRIDET